jgi:hypothetical protein
MGPEATMEIPTIRGLIDRRILVNLQVEPEALQRVLPAPLRPKLVAGVGTGGICLIRLRELRHVAHRRPSARLATRRAAGIAACLSLLGLAGCERSGTVSDGGQAAGGRESYCQPMTEVFREPGIYLIENPRDERYKGTSALVSMTEPDRFHLANLNYDAAPAFVDPADHRLVYLWNRNVWRFRAAAWSERNGVCRPFRPTDPLVRQDEQLATPPCQEVDHLVQRADGAIFYHCRNAMPDWVFRSFGGETWALAGTARPGEYGTVIAERPQSVVALDTQGNGLLVPQRADQDPRRAAMVLNPGVWPSAVELPGRVIASRSLGRGFEIAVACVSGCWARLLEVEPDGTLAAVGDYADPGVEPAVSPHRGAIIGPARELVFLGDRRGEIVSVRVPLDGERRDADIVASTLAPRDLEQVRAVSVRFLSVSDASSATPIRQAGADGTGTGTSPRRPSWETPSPSSSVRYLRENGLLESSLHDLLSARLLGPRLDSLLGDPGDHETPSFQFGLSCLHTSVTRRPDLTVRNLEETDDGRLYAACSSEAIRPAELEHDGKSFCRVPAALWLDEVGDGIGVVLLVENELRIFAEPGAGAPPQEITEFMAAARAVLPGCDFLLR